MATQTEGFKQEPPRLGNQYLEDSALCDVLRRYMPADTLTQVSPDLERFGWRVVRDVAHWGKEAELNKPQLIQVDGWGRRIDHIKVCDAWTQLEGVAAEEGLVALGYQRSKYGAAARIFQFAKLYLYSPAASVAHCPLAMTDGAARIIEIEKGGNDQRLRRAYEHLTSLDPKKFWTSGQWMTERTGGSDVGNTETIAQLQPDGTWALTGYKYFTSATTSQMAFTLARCVDDKGKALEGSRGLSMFFLETRKEGGELNNIQICKLKDKLGTRALPTAELELKRTPAILVGDRGKGVPAISTMFNITRIHNAIASIGSMRRAIAIARDYAHRRRAFGKLLADQPLHLATLAELDVGLRGCVFFTFEAIALLGKLENARATQADDALLRLLTPLIKLFTAKESFAAISECVESLGGTGFMEDATPLPRLLRDQQVCTIWEGTTNVLSLDTLRALTRVGFEPFQKTLEERTARIAANPTLSPLSVHASSLVASLRGNSVLSSEASARELSYFLSVLYITALMGDQAAISGLDKDAVYAQRWGARLEPYLRLRLRSAEDLKRDRLLALDVDGEGRMHGFGDVCHATHQPRARL